jgi:DNA-binding GntR family transcriptional regulator
MEFGPVGSMIPPILELVDQYDCGNNNTMIRHAQSVLIDEGLIEPRQGLGTFIIALPPSQDDKQAALAEAAEELRVALGGAQAALTKLLSQLALSVGRGIVRAATIQ